MLSDRTGILAIVLFTFVIGASMAVAGAEPRGNARGVNCTSINDVVDVFPPQCAIDARQPHEPNDPSATFGWNELVLNFGCDPTPLGLQSSDFSVAVIPIGVPPSISNVITDGVNSTVTVVFSQQIKPEFWTCVSFDEDHQWCMGYLPGDVDQNRLVNLTLDLFELILCLQGGPGFCDEWRTNIDRCPDGKICLSDPGTRFLELINGQNGFEVWAGRSLPDVCAVEGPLPVPAVSEWGLSAMVLLVLIAGTLVIRRCPSALA